MGKARALGHGAAWGSSSKHLLFAQQLEVQQVGDAKAHGRRDLAKQVSSQAGASPALPLRIWGWVVLSLIFASAAAQCEVWLFQKNRGQGALHSNNCLSPDLAPGQSSTGRLPRSHSPSCTLPFLHSSVHGHHSVLKSNNNTNKCVD